MAVTIQSNGKPRPLISWHDLTDNEQADFNYLDTDDRRDETQFFRYRDAVYDLSEFTRVGGNDIIKNWDGANSETYFSGVLIRFIDDDPDYIIVGSYYS